MPFNVNLNGQTSHILFRQAVTGEQENVISLKVYPAKQLLHLVGSVVLQLAQGIWQFLAHPKEGVKVYPAWH